MLRTPNAAYYVAIQAGWPALAYGVSGAAKTESLKALATATGRRLQELVASYIDPLDAHGGPFPAKTGDHIDMLMPKWAWNIIHSSEKWIIGFDEINRGSHAVNNAFLKIIAERTVGGRPLPDDTWIAGACNPPNLDPDVIELGPAMANRWYHHNWVLPRDAVLAGFSNGLRFPQPEFPVVPDNWRAMIGPVGSLISAFHKRCPSHLEIWPKAEAERSHAWASPRTWEGVIRCRAGAQAAGCDKILERELMEGLVGKVATEACLTYEDELDLPDPEGLIAAAIKSRDGGGAVALPEFPGRVDKEIAMLGAIHRCIVRDNSKPRWEGAMAMMEVACDRKVDVGLMGAAPLVQLAPAGAMAPMQLSQKLFPRLMRALGD